jgi:hypothetical protein
MRLIGDDITGPGTALEGVKERFREYLAPQVALAQMHICMWLKPLIFQVESGLLPWSHLSLLPHIKSHPNVMMPSKPSVPALHTSPCPHQPPLLNYSKLCPRGSLEAIPNPKSS